MQGTFEKEILCKLTNGELQLYGQEQSSIIIEINDLDEQKKALSTLQKPLKNRVQELALAIDNGEELHIVECKWLYNWEAGTKQARRIDNGHFTGSVEAIGEYERQEDLI